MTQDINVLQKEVRRNPGTPAFARLADRLRQDGSLGEATWICSRGLKVNPQYATGHTILAEILKEEGLKQRAKEEFGTALQLEPSNTRARLGLAQLLISDGEPQSAMEHTDILLFWEPYNTVAQKIHKEALRLLDTKEADALTKAPVKAAVTALPEDTQAAPPGLVPGREMELVDHITDCNNTSGAMIIDKEGLIVASKLALSCVDDAAAAQLAGMCKTSSHYLQLLGLGHLNGCLIEGENHAMRIMRYTDYVLTVSFQPEAKLGPAEIELNKAIEKLDRRRRQRASDVGLVEGILEPEHAQHT